MLQQTQVATVIPYYQQFLAKFPDIYALAKAPLDTVLKMWEGLGYYARARHLHQTARKIVGHHDGVFPTTEAGLRTLPGIGCYTASAIASIAFNESTPVLDGNVQRVLSRILCVKQNPKSPPIQKKFHAVLEEAIAKVSPSLFNQAMMELGQTVCIPRKPRCERCPLDSFCKAHHVGLQNRLPIRNVARKVPHYKVAVGVIWRNGKILIARRPEKGLLGGLWELPGGKKRYRETFEQCLRREIREETSVAVTVGAPLTTVRHRYSHFSVELHTFHCLYRSGKARPLQGTAVRWVTPRELTRFAFPSANKKIFEALRKNKWRDP